MDIFFFNLLGGTRVLTRDGRIAKPGYSGEQEGSTWGLLHGNLCWFQEEHLRTHIMGWTTSQLEARESGTGVTQDGILKRCVTKVTSQIARKREKMLNLISNQGYANLNHNEILHTHQNDYNIKDWQLLLAKFQNNWETLRLQIECKVVWPLWKTNWQYLLKLNVFLPYIIFIPRHTSKRN